LQDGYGEEVWEDQSKYIGNYKGGMKHGKGKYYWPDGSCYDGEWTENKINGKVLLLAKSIGEVYMD
jgi:hypothetical protein